MKYETYFKNYLELIEKKLDQILPPAKQNPSVIHQAMRYAVLNGGKRFRPILALSACEACAGKPEEALVPAISLELIHSYSLVHDDLPALDNDDMRRGKPSCHNEFGEAMAVLTGDALLTLAFGVLHQIQPSKKALQILVEISTASGTYGMIGGQVADITCGKADVDLPMLDYISIHKTGQLIRASVVSGAIASQAPGHVIERMQHYGEFLGLAFQAVDDLIDGDGYAQVMKARELRQKIRDLIAKAKREIRPLGRRAEKLQVLADFLLKRIPRVSREKMDRQN